MHAPLSHWHLDTFPAARRDQGWKVLVPFSIGADAKVSSVELFGERFDRVAE